jgi:hypothetical protein
MFAAGAQGWWWALLVPVFGVVVAVGTTRYRRRKEARGGYLDDPLADPEHYRNAPVPRTIEQAAWIRWTIAVCGVLIVVLGVFTLTADHALLVLAAIMVLVGGVIAVRGGRVGIVLDQDRLRVRGLTHSTTIPRASITSVDRLPSIDWTGRDGVPRETLVWALTGGADTDHDPNAIVRARARANLHAWLESGGAH